MFFKSLLVSAVVSCAAFSASAATVLDLSPETTGDPLFQNAGNMDVAQNFGTLFSLSEETELSAIDRYASSSFGPVGEDVVVKIWSSDGSTLLHDIASSISAQDGDGAGTSGLLRSRADFSVILAAGSYLIGVTGEAATQLEQSLLLGNTGSTFRFTGDTLIQAQPGSYASIRVFGDQPTPIPLPAGLPLLIGAIAMLGFATRRRVN